MSNDELKDLVLELHCDEANDNKPTDHVDQISSQEMSQHHIAHEEQKRQSQLNLELIKSCLGPLSQIFDLER